MSNFAGQMPDTEGGLDMAEVKARMNTACLILFSLLLSPILHGQNADTLNKAAPPGVKSPVDTVKKAATPAPKMPADSVALQQRIKAHVDQGVNSVWRSKRDSIFYTKYNKYGDLKDDDPVYNPRKPWWGVALKVLAQDVGTTSTDHYALRQDYAKVGFQSWAHNIKTGWEWDVDRLGMNFFLHPYSGASYANSALSSGYNYYQTLPFCIEGSLLYEYFGETTLPSYNDIINTSLSGALWGQILYRLSSNILDDRTTGTTRFFRELIAALVDPSRAFSRVTRGPVFRHTSKEIYQREPLNVTLSTGFRKLNDGHTFGTGTNSETINLQVDYGNPFEIRSRKPFDYFKMRADLNLGVGRKILDNINGEGIIVGGNSKFGTLEMLTGLFQHYDYWDNKSFELAAITFGGGVISKQPLFSNSNLYTTIHVGVVPFGANSTRYGPDTSQFRDYNYVGGLAGKFESTLEIGRAVSATFLGFYYWLHTYVGHKGDNYIGMIRPRLEIRCIKNFSVGAEQLIYYSDRFPVDFHPVHIVQTEQRIYLKVFFEQFKRKE